MSSSKYLEKQLTKYDLNPYNRVKDVSAVSDIIALHDKLPEGGSKQNTWEQRQEKELQEQRKRFYNALNETLQEDKGGEYSNFVKVQKDKNVLDENGRLTSGMLDELREFKQDELMLLEEKIKNARVPTEDIFGIKRRFCTVCEQGCNGYEPNILLVPKAGDFPTFCKNCKCPAHFHQIAIKAEEVPFPEELQQSIKNHNFSARDLNFNCVFMALQVRDLQTRGQNTNELLNILKEEGLEVISIEHQRQLEIEEAIYLKSRMVGQTENMMLRNFAQNPLEKTQYDEIRSGAHHGSAFTGKHGATDPFLMNQNAEKRENRLIQLTTKLEGQYQFDHLEHIPGVITIKDGTQKTQRAALTEKNLAAISKQVQALDTLNQRVPLNQIGAPSIARTSIVSSMHSGPLDEQQLLETLNQVKRDPLVTTKKSKHFKVCTNVKHRTQLKSKVRTLGMENLCEEEKEALLISQIERDPLLQELISKPLIVLAISSSTYQNLSGQIKSQVLPKFHVFLPPEEMPLLYLSESKIASLEDCIIFFPDLFRLTKSIVVSEPTEQNPLGASMMSNQDQTSTNLQLQLREGMRDMSNPDLMSKLQSLQKNNDLILDNIDSTTIEEMREEEEELGRGNRGTLKVRTSRKLRLMLQQRETLKQNQLRLKKMKDAREEETLFHGQEEGGINWIQQAQARDKLSRKKNKLLSQHNKLLYNYGVLHDFFNYSAMSIQSAVNEVDLAAPTTDSALDGALYAIRLDRDANSIKKSNIFAIAKIGLPNLILPSSLDIRLSNYSQYQAYLYLADAFFPKLSTSQLSVIVVRPPFVKTGLSEFLIRILKLNDFTILKRKTRMLAKPEVAFLAEQEGILPQSANSDSKETKSGEEQGRCEMYYNLMMDSECEVVAVTKVGCVADLKSIVDGCAPLGRRRVAQLDEDTSAIRSNVDAVNSMYEITPFSSMSEFLDLEDFLVSHSKLDKYKKQYKSQSNRLNDQLYFQKIDLMRKELNLFSRYFNLVAHVPASETQAQMETCVLMPEIAIVEEVIVILNPLYTSYIEAAEKLIQRMNFKVHLFKAMLLSQEEANELFKEKKVNVGGNTKISGGDKLARLLGGNKVHVWHLSKIAAERELRQLFEDAQIEMEDVLRQKVRSTPFRERHFPYLFVMMDSPHMFETAYKLLWGPEMTEVSGQQLIDGMNYQTRLKVLEMALLVTVGDTIKELTFNKDGQIVLPDADLTESTHQVLYSKIPQIYQLYGNSKGSTAVHSLVESESHGLYEIRFTRLPHKGDFYNLAVDPEKVNLERLKQRYFTKFQALNLYYNEVNQHLYNVCPAFYRFKISPLVPEGHASANLINRVFEVEEYMGRPFIEEVAYMHQEHVNMIRNNLQSDQQSYGKSLGQMILDSEQRSLPAYAWAGKVAKMCTELEKIRGSSSLKGSGRILFEDQNLKGEVTDAREYFNYDKNRFGKYLEDFKKGWKMYLSSLECDLIEAKLRRILDSQTFKHTRQPSFISLIPDRMTEINLRISEKIQLLMDNALDSGDTQVKFYKHLSQDQLDPSEEESAVNMVQSIMQTLYLERTSLASKKKRFMNNNGGRGFKVEELTEEIKQEDAKKGYTVHKDCAVVGIEVARRPKYQLIASIMFLINFHFRRIDRKTDLFDDLERVSSVSSSENDQESQRIAEAVYDQVLDTMMIGISDNFDLNQALDIVTLQEKLALETDYERIVREKQLLETKLKEALKGKIEAEERTRRTTMKLEDLLESVSTSTKETSSKFEDDLRQRQTLKNFVLTQGASAGSYQDLSHSDGFQQVLSQTQAYMGPYSLKMANDYVQGQEKAQKPTSQERISFVKMEYFLYAVSEAHRITLELREMESRHKELKSNEQFAHAELASLGHVIPGYYKTKEEEVSFNQRYNIFQGYQKKVEQLKAQISLKEQELLLTLKELMTWNYHVPDHFFDKEAMLDIQKQHLLKETFLLPVDNIWRPVYFDNYKEEELHKPTFAKRVRDFSTTQAPPIWNEGSESERNFRPGQGVLVSALRPYDVREPNDYIRLGKFYSQGEYDEQRELARIKAEIQSRLSRVTKDYGQRFRVETPLR